MSEKKNIRHLHLEDLKNYVGEVKQPAYRAKQVFEWLWKKDTTEFAQMKNVPSALLEKLEADFFIPKMKVVNEQKSSDGTIKSGFELHDGKLVEGVLIPSNKRMTACISSQVGCSLACSFCATGTLDLKRNLTADEIYDQVRAINKQSKEHYEKHLSNIVYMGMGEPLLNYKEMLRSIEMITTDDGLAMSPRRITVSTAGIAKMIRKLGDDEVKFNLALSLHAANDTKRNRIMAINESNNLSVLSDALRYFQDKTGTRITFEYIVFRNFNDSLQDAAELAEFCKAVACKINLIEYNPIEGGKFVNADQDKIEAFAKFLEEKNLIVNIRRSRGKDIDAACGQLANKAVKNS